MEPNDSPQASRANPVRRVVIVVFEDHHILDLTGPLAVFDAANEMAHTHGDSARYRVDIAASTHTDLSVRSSCGLAVGAHFDIADVDLAAIDTLMVVGGDGTEGAYADDRLMAFLQAAAPVARRVTSVCSGSFLLAHAGLLDGRSATTHWSRCSLFGELFPTVDIDMDAIFVRDGNVWTSAGVTAGMDLCLALVEDDLGQHIARGVAKELVLFVQRPGGQSQFSTQLASQQPTATSMAEIARWIQQNLDADLSVGTLAETAGMSRRTFSRTFVADMTLSPARYVEAVRTEAAKQLLETTQLGLDQIAKRCGFGTTETFHRSFQRTVHTTPGEYRERFGTRFSATTDLTTDSTQPPKHLETL